MIVQRAGSLVRTTFTSLKYPNFRLWFIGQIISLFGTWMQSSAQAFLAYELTGSKEFLGLISFAAGLPSWIFIPMGGVISDRLPRRTLLVITQTCMMILAFILAALTFTGKVQPWHLVVLAFLLGVANAFDAPARMAFSPELVEREDLTNAIALNGTMFNTALIVGPAAGAIVYDRFGPAWCFTLNGLSFVAVIIALLLMKLAPHQPPVQRHSAMREMLDGLRYVFKQKTILALIGIVMMVAMFGFAFITLMPAWSVEVLGGDVKTNGLLMSFRGIGAVLGALSIASLGRFKFRGRLLTTGLFAFPTLLIIFAFIRWMPAAYFVISIMGMSVVMIMNLANSLVQSNTEDAVRGRVMGLYSLVFFGFNSIGSLMMGALAERAGLEAALLAGAGIVLIFAISLWLFVPRVRRLE